MSITYTEHYEFGKQEDYSDLFSMKVITDNWDSLDELLYAFDSAKQNTIDSEHPIDGTEVRLGTYSKATTKQDIAENDTVKTALGKVEKRIEDNENNILSGFTMVAHASANGATSLSYDTNVNDFNIGGANSDKSSGSYLVICTNWSTTPAPYVGLLTFSGATGNKFVKTDIITGFAPTITITQNVANATIDISGAAKISIYATK